MGEMRERMARAIARDGYTGDESWWESYLGEASAALEAMQIPSNRAVAHAADKLGMDPTKVAAVWMCIIEGELKDA